MNHSNVILAGEVFDWISGTTSWIRATIPIVFLTAVLVLGVWMLIKSHGGIRKVIGFALGAAVVYMLLTNVDTLGDMFGSELKGAPAGHFVVVDASRPGA